MSKEYLEALKVIKNIKLSHVETEEDEDFDGNWVYDTIEVDDGLIGDKYPKQIKILKQALQRLEAIDNANSSKALKYVNGKIADLEDDLQHYTMVDKDKCKEFYIRENLKQLNTIKQALIKAQEQENVLEIIKEKKVDIWKFIDNGIFNYSYDDYYFCWNYYSCKKLTQEEFDLLKSWLDNKKGQ